MEDNERGGDDEQDNRDRRPRGREFEKILIY